MREDDRFEKFRLLGMLYWDHIWDDSIPTEHVKNRLGRELVEIDPFDGSTLVLKNRDYVWMDMVRLARDLGADRFSSTRIKDERGTFSKSMVDKLLYQVQRGAQSALFSEWEAHKLVCETREMLRKYPDRAEALRRKSKPFLREVVAATVPVESPRYVFQMLGDPLPPEIVSEQYQGWKTARAALLRQISDL